MLLSDSTGQETGLGNGPHNAGRPQGARHIESMGRRDAVTREADVPPDK